MECSEVVRRSQQDHGANELGRAEAAEKTHGAQTEAVATLSR